ncbi:MAG: MFS transporter [Tetrasphaera sp.]
MTQHANTQGAGAAEPPATRPSRVVFGSLLLVMSLAGLDQTIIATSLRAIVADLGSVGALAWVVTVYLIASTATTPLWGRLGDARGKKPMLIASVVIFLLASCASGAATHMGWLIGARAVQGIGAGGMMALSSATVADLVEPRQRGRYMGYVQSMFALASVVGPLAGGALVDHASWRWIFYVNLPIGVLGLVGLVRGLPARGERLEHRIDYFGAALLAAAVVKLQLLVLWGPERGWTSVEVLGLLGLLVLGLVVLVWRQRTAAEPIIPPSLLADPTIRVVATALFIATGSLFAATTFMPLYLQVVRGEPATTSGLLLIPMMLGITITTAIVGRVMSATGRYKIFPVTGMLVTAAALFGCSRLDTDTSWAWVLTALLGAGVGFGMVTQVLVVAIQNGVDGRLLASATATANLFRSLGGAIGVAVLGSVFNAGLVSSGAAGTDRLVADADAARATGSATPAALAGVQDALTLVFVVAALAALVAVAFCLRIEERPMRQWGAPPAGGKPAGQQGDHPAGQPSDRPAGQAAAPPHAGPDSRDAVPARPS